MPSALDLHAQLTADSKVWVRETQKAAKAFTNLATTTQKQAKQTEKALSTLSKFLKGTLTVAIGFSLSRQIMKTAASLKSMGKNAIWGAGRIQQMSQVLDMLGRKLGYTSSQMKGFTEAIREKGIEMGIAQNTLQEFIRYEMDLSKSTELARVAQDAAVMSNSNSSETLQRLIYGIARQNSLILRNAGIQVMAGQAIDEYAASLGKSAQALTTTERTQAVLNAVLKEGKKINGAYEESLKEPLKKLGSLKRIYQDMYDIIGKALYPIFKAFVNDGLDPFVKWIKKSIDEGTAFNNWLSNFGENAAKAFQAFVEFARGDAADSLRNVADSASKIVKEFLEITSIMKPLIKIIFSTKLWDVALQSLAKTLDAVAVIAKPLAPLLQGLIVMKMLERVVAITKSTRVYASVLALETREKLMSAGATKAYGAANLMATPPTIALGVATAFLGKALRGTVPLLLAFLAIKAITKILEAITGGADKAAEQIQNLSRAFRNAGNDIEAAEKALDDYIDTQSRFESRNQIDDLEALAHATKISRERLHELLALGDEGLKPFIEGLLILGGKQGLVQATAEELQALRDASDGTELSFREVAKAHDWYITSSGKLIKGNLDLIESFETEADVLSRSAKANIASFAAENEAHAELVANVIAGYASESGAQRQLVRDILNSATVRQKVLSGEIDLGLNWVDVQNSMQVASKESEEAAVAEAKALEDLIKADTEYLQKAQKLAGVKEFATEKTKQFWFELVKEREAVEGLNEALDETFERLSIFSAHFNSVIQLGQTQNEIFRDLAEVTELVGKETTQTGQAEQALLKVVQKSVSWAKDLAESRMLANGVTEDSAEADAILRKALEEVSAAMRTQVAEAGVLQDELEMIMSQLMGLDGFSAEIKLMQDLGIEQNLQGFKDALENILANPRQFGSEITDQLVPFLELMVKLQTDQTEAIKANITALKTVSDIETLITGKVVEQSDERRSGLSAIFRWVRAAKALQDIETTITRLEKEKADLLSENGRFYLEAELSVLRQERSLHRLVATLEDLKNLNDEVKSIDDVRKKVEELESQQSSITGIEKELIKVTDKFTEAQAALGDVTAIEAGEIEELAIALQAAERQHKHGVISTLALEAAHMAVTEAIKEALKPSDELAEARAELNRLETAAITIEQDLAIAEREVELASRDVAEAVSAETAVLEQLVVVEDQLREAAMQQVTATYEEKDAFIELAREGKNVESVLEDLRTGGYHLTNEFGHLIAGIDSARKAAEAFYPEFETLRLVLQHIEIEGLDAQGIHDLHEQIKQAIEEGQSMLDKWGLMAKIRSMVDPETDWDKWRREIQEILENWDLKAVVKFLFDIPDKPQFGGDTITIPPIDSGTTDPVATGTPPDVGDIKSFDSLFAGLQDASTLTQALAVESAIKAAGGAEMEARLALAQSAIVSGTSPADILAFFDHLNTPKMAKGGIVRKATPLIAGEAGPEAIVPLGKGLGGATYNINVGAGVSDPAAVAEAVVEALRAYERGNGPVPVTTVASMYTASA